MKKKKDDVTVQVMSSHGLRWNHDGTCEESVDDGPWRRRPDCDWGTPNGDLLIDPWAQKLIATPKEQP